LVGLLDRRVRFGRLAGYGRRRSEPHSAALNWSAIMNRREHVRSRIVLVNESLARLRAERSRLVARATQSERKRDTRQKILIGAAVLAAVQHEGVPALRSSDELLAWLEPRLTRPHDRGSFDFKPPRAQ
jgi:hypothetical protein